MKRRFESESPLNIPGLFGAVSRSVTGRSDKPSTVLFGVAPYPGLSATSFRHGEVPARDP